MPQVPESHRDLLDSCQVVILATLGSDGFLQVTAVWFALDADGMPVMSLNTSRQKVKNLQRNPECTLFFMDPASPYRRSRCALGRTSSRILTIKWQG